MSPYAFRFFEDPGSDSRSQRLSSGTIQNPRILSALPSSFHPQDAVKSFLGAIRELVTGLLVVFVYSLLLEDLSSVVVDNTQLTREFAGHRQISVRGNDVLIVESRAIWSQRHQGFNWRTKRPATSTAGLMVCLLERSIWRSYCFFSGSDRRHRCVGRKGWPVRVPLGFEFVGMRQSHDLSLREMRTRDHQANREPIAAEATRNRDSG